MKKFKINEILSTYSIPIFLIVFGIILVIISNYGMFSKENNNDIKNNNNNNNQNGNNNQSNAESENIKYYITLNGDDCITIYKGEKYIDPGYRGYDSKNNDLTNNIIVSNNIDINKVGEYKVIYTLNDTSQIRYVNVVEKVVGISSINLKGNENINLYIGDEYIEPGYTAIDTIDGDITKNVVVSNNINNNMEGVYKVKYSVKNSSSIITEKVRNVVVSSRPIGVLNLELYGSDVIYLDKGKKYTEPGYIATDSIDGDITKKVQISNNIDYSKVGAYQIKYSISNSTNVSVVKIRSVFITDNNVNVTFDKTTYTNQDVTINLSINDDYFDYLVLPNNTKVYKKNYSYKVSENGTYVFNTYNKINTGKTITVEIRNINRTSPTGSCSGSYKNGVSIINVSANDDIGVAKYVYGGISYTTNQIKINKEIKTANITIYDKAGNSKNISCSLKNRNDLEILNSITPGYNYKKKTKNVTLNYYVSSTNKKFSYWVYLPDNVVDNLPVVLYMGGLDTRGNDYMNNKETCIRNGLIDEVLKHGAYYNAIIVNPQVPDNEKSYEYLSSYRELVSKIANEYNADKKKISTVGFSHGCYGVLNIVGYNGGADFFSAAVPIGCSCNHDPSLYTKLPIWCFVGAGDGAQTSDNSYGRGMQTFVNMVNDLGGNAKFSRVPYRSHEIIINAYSVFRDTNYNVMDWVFKQSK